MNTCTEIITNLFLENIVSSQSGKYDLVVNCSDTVERTVPFISRQYIQVPIIDNSSDTENKKMINNLTNLTNSIYETISMGGSVLVHCHGGVSRSATVVVAFLMKYCNLSLIQSIVYVKNKRPMVFSYEGVNFEAYRIVNEAANRATRGETIDFESILEEGKTHG